MKGFVRELSGDWMGRVLLGMLVIFVPVLVWMMASLIQSEVAYQKWQTFQDTHKCVRSGQYWGGGYFVGIPGKGGYYKSAGWRFVCYEWFPNDPEPPIGY